jgi:hypothetical protein
MAASSRVGRAIVAALAVASAAAFAACGSSSTSEQVSSSTDAPAQVHPQAFAWLHPTPPPSSWHVSTLPNGRAQLAFPASWRSIVSDPGTRTAAIRNPHGGRIAGYLNATPQQGEETLGNWSSFRLEHNQEEGDTNVKLVAAADNLMFRGGHGSCVIDDYRTSSGHQYREIACIVAGARATTVVVGAAPPQDWHSQSPSLERAISAFKT